MDWTAVVACAVAVVTTRSVLSRPQTATAVFITVATLSVSSARLWSSNISVNRILTKSDLCMAACMYICGYYSLAHVV